MLDLTQKEKINRFLSDVVMADTVKKVLLDSFLALKEGDVQTKAAQMMAVNLLEDGFKELQRSKKPEEQEDKPLTQVGL